MTGPTRLVSIDLLYTETGWGTLVSRSNKLKLITFHKMLNGLSPRYLSALLPPTVSANVSYNSRNQTRLRTIHCHSQLYYNSFLPSILRTWNGLSKDTLNINRTASLKYHLNTNLNPPPLYCKEGKRLT